MLLSDESRLIFLLLLNAAILGAWVFAARRWTGDWLQACIDGMLLWYLTQYISVGLPGVLHILSPISMVVVGLIIALAAGGIAYRFAATAAVEASTGESRIYLAAGIFFTAFLVSVIVLQNLLALTDTDALVYHVPAAVQWLQTHHVGIFPTWFFNPANSFSPLAGSTFITWLIAPLGNDVLARCVQAPAMLLIFLTMLRLCRSLGISPLAAALFGLAAAGSRLTTSEIINARDDIFLGAFILIAVAGSHREILRDRFGPWRIGIAIGLALATKYTALLSLPMLIFLWGASRQAGWDWRKYATMFAVIFLIAGPWYLRNLILTGNPVFPLDVSIFGRSILPGVFTVHTSARLRSMSGIWNVLVGGYNGPPPALAIALLLSWLAGVALLRNKWRDPLARTIIFGPLLCLVIFLARSPYGEVRFLFPAALLMTAAGALAAGAIPWRWGALLVGAIAAAISVLTSYAIPELIGEAVLGAGCVASIWVGFVWLDSRLGTHRMRVRAYGAMLIACLFAAEIYIEWRGFLRRDNENYPGYKAAQPIFWRNSYPAYAPAWDYVRTNVPPDATLAYSNTVLVYPLYGFELKRPVTYVPVRADVPDVLHLPHFPTQLGGEEINDAFADLLNSGADREVWLRRMKESGAKYLLVGIAHGVPPEVGFATSEPARFVEVFKDKTVVIYRVQD